MKHYFKVRCLYIFLYCTVILVVLFPTPRPAACRSHWRLCLSSGSHKPPPTARSGRPQPAHCQRTSCQPDEQHLGNQM